MVEEVIVELGKQGHPGVTANQEFALVAIDDGADNASELGRRLQVSKQAAAKTMAVLKQLGYVERDDDPADARRKTLRVTERGYDMTRIGGQLFDHLWTRWADSMGKRNSPASRPDSANWSNAAGAEKLPARNLRARPR